MLSINCLVERLTATSRLISLMNSRCPDLLVPMVQPEILSSGALLVSFLHGNTEKGRFTKQQQLWQVKFWPRTGALKIVLLLSRCSLTRWSRSTSFFHTLFATNGPKTMRIAIHMNRYYVAVQAVVCSFDLYSSTLLLAHSRNSNGSSPDLPLENKIEVGTPSTIFHFKLLSYGILHYR